MSKEDEINALLLSVYFSQKVRLGAEYGERAVAGRFHRKKIRRKLKKVSNPDIVRFLKKTWLDSSVGRAAD